jgi:hypothetical protein
MTIRARAEVTFGITAKLSRDIRCDRLKGLAHRSLRTRHQKQIPLSVARAAGAPEEKQRATTLGMTIFLVGGQGRYSDRCAELTQTATGRS